MVHIGLGKHQFPFADGEEEIGRRLEMMKNRQLVVRRVADGEFACRKKGVQHLFALLATLALHLAQGGGDAPACFPGGDVVEPVGLNGLLARGEYFDLIAVRQSVAHRHEAVVHFRAQTVTSHHGVNGKSEVEHRRSLRKRDDFALRCEDV